LSSIGRLSSSHGLVWYCLGRGNSLEFAFSQTKTDGLWYGGRIITIHLIQNACGIARG
jgi:hypothetical protein